MGGCVAVKEEKSGYISSTEYKAFFLISFFQVGQQLTSEIHVHAHVK